MRSSSILALPLAAALACAQDVIPPPCDAHVAAPDAGTSTSPDAMGLDAEPSDSGAPADAAPLDAAPDAGDPRCPGRICLTLAASATVANVRDTITLTPTVDNPAGLPLTFGGRPTDLTGERRAGRPAVVLGELSVDLLTDSTTGVTTLRISEVPPWFVATTFRVRLHVSGGGEEAFAEATVHIRGNTVFSGIYSDVSRVYAVASDGRPARARMPSLMSGELITQLARAPAALLMSRDGTLIVHDSGAQPPRLMRFELTGHDQQLSTFDFRDPQMAPYLDSDPTYPHSLAELADGRVVVADYDFSRTPKSRLVVFGADGAHRVTLPAPDPGAVWTGIGVHESGDVLLARLDGGGRVERVDPATGVLREVFAEGLPSSARAVLGLAGGVTYVAGDSYVVRIVGRQRSLVNMLPTNGFSQWRILAPYADGRVLASNEERSDAMPGVIRDRLYAGRLRATGAGNVSTGLRGMAYLD